MTGPTPTTVPAPTPRSLPRTVAALALPGVATYLAWWALLGRDDDDLYTVGQCAALVLALIAIGIVAGLLARGRERWLVVASAVLGIAVGCWTGWSDDESGLFVVGWIMVVTAAVPATICVVLGSGALGTALRRRTGRA